MFKHIVCLYSITSSPHQRYKSIRWCRDAGGCCAGGGRRQYRSARVTRTARARPRPPRPRLDAVRAAAPFVRPPDPRRKQKTEIYIRVLIITLLWIVYGCGEESWRKTRGGVMLAGVEGRCVDDGCNRKVQQMCTQGAMWVKYSTSW